MSSLHAGNGRTPPKGCVLITGCAGFIGSHTAVRLLSEGYDVIGVDNINNYYDKAIKESALAECEACAAKTVGVYFKFYKADITNLESMTIIFGLHKFEKIDHV